MYLGTLRFHFLLLSQISTALAEDLSIDVYIKSFYTNWYTPGTLLGKVSNVHHNLKFRIQNKPKPQYLETRAGRDTNKGSRRLLFSAGWVWGGCF